MRTPTLLPVLLLAPCLSCLGPAEVDEPVSRDGGEGSPDAWSADAVEDDAAVADAGCGSAAGQLPPGLTELRWDIDDERSRTHVVAGGWQVNGLPLEQQVLDESVRFDLEHPARIFGFSLRWANTPADAPPDLEIPASLYADFGHNGFDHWIEPLWTGTRCLGDVRQARWTDYVLPEPLEIPHPGLIYAGHRRARPDDVALFMDGSPSEGDCSLFAACHSAMNLPEVDAELYFNGTSFPIGSNYLLRLYVEYIDPRDPAQDLFEDVSGALPIGQRHAFGDCDGDGDDDLLSGGVLLRNQGGGFSDVTAAAGLGQALVAGGVWGDFDNDGCLDLFTFTESTRDADSLWQGDCGCGFTDVTAVAGLAETQTYNLCQEDPAQDQQPTPAAAWWDIDADGLLDLYVANFICWADNDFYRDQVYHNLGDGRFEPWSETRGFLADAAASRGAAPADVDGDGDVDLVVNSYRLLRNYYYENQGDGSVLERAIATGLAGVEHAFQGYDYYGHTIGVAWGDLDNDLDLDLIEANLAHPRFYHFSDKTRVLRNEGGIFTDTAGDWARPVSAAGLRYQETHSVPLLGDFDQDGDLDLVLSAVYDGRPTDFYWGQGDGTFALDAYRSGIGVKDGWGQAAADIDQDGDLDLVAKGALYRNRGRGGHWLQVKLVGGGGCSRDAYGAAVRVYTADAAFLRQVEGGGAQGNQNSSVLHFGLGDATAVARVEVDFPGAGQVTFTGPFQVDQRLWLHQDGTVARGWAP